MNLAVVYSSRPADLVKAAAAWCLRDKAPGNLPSEIKANTSLAPRAQAREPAATFSAILVRLPDRLIDPGHRIRHHLYPSTASDAVLLRLDRGLPANPVRVISYRFRADHQLPKLNVRLPVETLDVALADGEGIEAGRLLAEIQRRDLEIYRTPAGA